jgi:glycolate oxidase
MGTMSSPAVTIDRELLAERLRAIVGFTHVRMDDGARAEYGIDALRQGALADVVVSAGNTAEVAAIARVCHDTRTPLVPRGAGTGFTGGAVPVHGGVVLSLERLNRILAIDESNLLAVVQPHVITGDLQDAVERVGLFYPPDPASLRRSSIGGNVAECAGGPRAFKYGVTRQYVLGLEAVLPTGEVLRTGGKVVKNVVGYDLTQLLVGSEGTLAIITEITLRLIPKPPAVATLRATFRSVSDAVAAAGEIVRARVTPSTLELIDQESLDVVSRYLAGRSLAPAGTAAVLILEVDGQPEQVRADGERVAAACTRAGATEVLRASSAEERDELWSVRREISPALLLIAEVKINHDVVVPKGRLPQLFELIGRLKQQFGMPIPSFGHVGDGNVHVNIMVENSPEALARGREAEAELFRGVVALDGSISGEHGIGFSKAKYLDLELGREVIALMRRVKTAFDPHGILNPGKIFPESR